MAIYQIGSRITHESLDGEVIAIHFDTGAYYSLRGSAARIWEVLADSPASPDAIASRFEGGAVETGASVDVFLKSLCEEGLAELADAEVSGTSEEDGTKGDLAFEKPEFERFDDMRELLLADPIHEVDEEGWPQVQA